MERDNSNIDYFELWDKDGSPVADFGDIDKFPNSFQVRNSENFSEGNYRNIYRSTEQGSVRLIVEKDNPLFQGNKWTSRSCSIYLSLIPKFKKIEQSRRNHYAAVLKRFAHNLVNFQTRFKGNFARLISDAARSRPFHELKDEVKRRIDQDTDRAAEDVAQMSHRAVDLDAQIDTLRIIAGYADSPNPDNKIKVDLQKAIYRLTNPFKKELEQRDVSVQNQIQAPQNNDDKVLIDPSLFNAAIWQLLDNATKYAKDDSVIQISADINTKPQNLKLEMISVCIDKDEEDHIFLEGKKGRHAGVKGEHGIGLYVVRKALKLMGARVSVEGKESVTEENGFKYCRNIFTIEF